MVNSEFKNEVVNLGSPPYGKGYIGENAWLGVVLEKNGKLLCEIWDGGFYGEPFFVDSYEEGIAMIKLYGVDRIDY